MALTTGLRVGLGIVAFGFCALSTMVIISCVAMAIGYSPLSVEPSSTRADTVFYWASVLLFFTGAVSIPIGLIVSTASLLTSGVAFIYRRGSWPNHATPAIAAEANVTKAVTRGISISSNLPGANRQFDLAGVLLVTAFAAISFAGVVTALKSAFDGTQGDLVQRAYWAIDRLRFATPFFVPAMFLAYIVGRRRISVSHLLAFAAVEFLAVLLSLGVV